MPQKINLNLEQLEELYLSKNLTKQECADILNVSLSTISRAIKQYNIVKDKTQVYTKIAENNLIKYGVTNIAKLPEIQDKIKTTCIAKYGVDNAAKAASVQQKTQQTNFQKYGYSSTLSVPEIQKKIKNTCIMKYGVDFAVKASDVRAKINITNTERFGGNSPFSSEAVRKKAAETNIERYGVPNQFQTETFKSVAWKRYKFDENSFDSSLELMLWIYAKDHNEQIEREPIRFTYSCNEKLHYYTPDFLYKDELIEINGDHLIQDGRLVDIYGHMSPEELIAKQQCLIANNVRIITKDDMKTVITYIEATYGKNYIKQFKTKIV